MKQRVAIVGTGISGMACAYFLHKRFELILFEQNSHIGGHSLTVDALEGSKKNSHRYGVYGFQPKDISHFNSFI